MLGTLSSISSIFALYTSFLTTFCQLHNFFFFKSTGTGFNLSASNSANLSISNLSTSVFKLAKSSFLDVDVSTSILFFKPYFVA